MTTFVLLIQSDCFASPVLADVRRFCLAALAQGHQIDHLFFYHQAVGAIAPAPDLPADEPDLVAALLADCQQWQIPLLYCATAAEKRGLHHARQGFTLSGLAEFAGRLHTAKLVQF